LRLKKSVSGFSGKGPQANFQFTAELGASRLMHKLIGAEAVIGSHSGGPVAADAKVFLEVDRDKLHLFDAATGRNLGLAAA
jgi:hypothetical protein